MNAEPRVRSRGNPATLEIRKQAGLWLKQKREDAGLTQRELAELLELDYYTIVSQLETGRGRVSPARYVDWARALRIDPREFVYHLMRFYDPETFRILFDNQEWSRLKLESKDDHESGCS